MTSLIEMKSITDFSSVSDKLLVDKIIDGDDRAIEYFLSIYCSKIFTYLKNNHLKQIDLSEIDLANDFFIFLKEKDWQKLRRFNHKAKLSTWVNVVASRYFIKKYNKELKENARKNTPIEGIRSFVNEDANVKLIYAELLDAINQLLDKRYRKVLLLGLQGYSPHEIAKHLDTSTNNVYVIKSRAIDQLKSLMNE